MVDRDAAPRRSLGRDARLGLGLALLLYVLLAAFVHVLALRLGDDNPVHQIATGDPTPDALLIVGASHALPLTYGDMGATVEDALGRPVTNLAMPGAGIVPNALLLDAYLRKHGPEGTGGVLYVLDPFAFRSAEWNEARLEDVGLWQKAPLDGSVAAALWRAVWRDGVAFSVWLDYLSGFSKLNDPTTWFAPDVWEDAARFDERYEPNALLDQERVAYLYPEDAREPREGYWDRFARLAQRLEAADVPLLVVRPPLRDAFREAIPAEARFERRLGALLDEHDVPLHDASELDYPADHYFDPDHLNRRGVRRFLREELVQAVDRHLPPP